MLAKLAVLCLALAGALPTGASSADLMTFWDAPQKGGNSFNAVEPDETYFKALAATGATWVRLTFSKWRGEGRDFLIGDADHYNGLPPEDLAKLIDSLDVQPMRPASRSW